MALKSETLQLLPVLVGCCNNKKIDDRTSGDEDLEDGEIFDDDEDEENKEKKVDKDTKVEEKKQPVDVPTSKKEGGKSVSSNESNGPDKLFYCVTVNSSVGFRNEKGMQYLQNSSWREGMADGDDSVEKKNKKSKKRKRRRGDDDDDDGDIKIGEKKKKIRKSVDKDGLLSTGDSNNGDDVRGQQTNDNDVPVGEDDDDDDDDGDEDDDEMLFVRGASPQRFNHHSNNNNRHYQDGFQSDGDNEEMDFDEDNDYMENDDDLDNCDDGERRSHSNSRFDRTARRERLSARGKRRGHVITTARKKRDDNEVCIFYMQGKCHKGSDCQFSHEAMPHKKQELCKFYLMDCCNKKDKCLYMHSEFPCKYFHMGLKCYANKNCRFSHSKLSDSMRQVFIKTFGPIRSKGEFPNKKGPTNKHGRPQDAGADYGRPREGRRDGGDSTREKKIPSLFDIKVSIPDEMRKDYDSDSDGGGNRTPMPSPPLGQLRPSQQISDSSRSPPQVDSSSGFGTKRRRKERKHERSLRKGRERGNDSDNDSANSRRLLMPGGPFSNDSWDDTDHQDMLNRLRMEYDNLNDDDRSGNNSNNDNSSGPNNNNSNKSFLDCTDNNKMDHVQNYHKHQQHYDSDGSDSHKYETSTSGLENTTQNSDSPSGATQSVNPGDEMVPSHLPKKQRELFLRIQQQQRQAGEVSSNRQQQVSNDSDELKDISGGDSCGESGDRLKSQNEDNTVNVSALNDKLNANESSGIKSQSDDQNWYSSDEDDYEQHRSSSGIGVTPNTSITAILQNLVRLNNSSNGENCSTGVTSSISNPYNDARLTPPIAGANARDDTSGRNDLNTAATSISNVDFDVNEVSELLSKVKQHFQASEKKIQEKRRDPRLRSDVGPSGDNLSGNTTTSSASLNSGAAISRTHDENRGPVISQNDDADHRSNATDNRGVGAGDMDLRNLPFKPAPVHSAATEIDASINSYVPPPYKLIPIIVPKPDYSNVQMNSKVGAADPRIRKTVRLSDDTTTVVSSRDPRHRLIDDLNKKTTPTTVPQNPDPRQRSRVPTAPVVEEQPMMLPPSLSHIRPAYPPMPGAEPNVMHSPISIMDDESCRMYPPPSPVIAPPISRPGDPRQRHMQNDVRSPTQSQGAALFDVLAAMNGRQPGFLGQNADPRSRPSGISNIVFPGALMRPDNSSINKGQYGFK